MEPGAALDDERHVACDRFHPTERTTEMAGQADYCELLMEIWLMMR